MATDGAPAPYKIVLLRHGESEWNKANKFTGWTDVDLTDTGVQEARGAAGLIKDAGLTFDVAFSSVLKRANRTLQLVQEEMGLTDMPVHKSYRLNERHYGALQGLNKAETAERHGAEQVHIWRRSYDVPPPALEPSDERHPSHDALYSDLKPEELPCTESLKLTVARVLPYWESSIVPAIRDGKKVLIAAHGNSLRALVKYLDDVSEGDITGLNIPTGVPLVYELDADLKPVKHYYLGDAADLEARVAKTTNVTAGK